MSTDYGNVYSDQNSIYLPIGNGQVFELNIAEISLFEEVRFIDDEPYESYIHSVKGVVPDSLRNRELTFYYPVTDGINTIDASQTFFFGGSQNIQVSDLISNNLTIPFVEAWDTITDFNPNSTLKFYIGNEYILHKGGRAIPHNAEETWFILNHFSEIDKLISIDFEWVTNEEEALIRIYKISENSSITHESISTAPDETLLGYASGENPDDPYDPYAPFSGDEYIDVLWLNQTLGSPYFNNKDIEINSYYGTNIISDYLLDLGLIPESEGLTEGDAFIITHEIGHSLGLDHPNSDPYGSWHDYLDTAMSYNWKSKNSNNYTVEIPLSEAPNFSENDLDALQFIWGSENPSNSEYSLLSDISDDGIINESIANGGINYDNLNDKLTGLAMNNHNHSHNVLLNPSAIVASQSNELDLEKLSNINPFDDHEIEFTEFAECLNESCLETNQNSSIIDPITYVDNNKATIFEDAFQKNSFKDENFI